MPRKAPVSTACRQFLIQVTRWWRCSSSAWTGILLLASPALLSLSFQNCNRRRWISWIFYKRICLKRQAKRESGILRRHTVFYTRSGRLCCGATRIIHLVKLQRYRFVWTRSDSVQTCFILNMNWYILVHTIF